MDVLRLPSNLYTYLLFILDMSTPRSVIIAGKKVAHPRHSAERYLYAIREIESCNDKKRCVDIDDCLLRIPCYLIKSVFDLIDLFDTPYFVSSSINILAKAGKLYRIYKRKLTHQEGGLPREQGRAHPSRKWSELAAGHPWQSPHSF